MATVDSNKLVARRYLEQFWNGNDPAVIAEIAVADVIGHPTPSETLQGCDILVQRHAGLRRIYGDPYFVVEDLIAEDDKVLLRWSFTGKHIGPIMGVNPTGKQVSIGGMNLFHLAGGKIVEFWVNADDLGELQQLGAIPGA
jgi:predicted ester cyclase